MMESRGGSRRCGRLMREKGVMEGDGGSWRVMECHGGSWSVMEGHGG